MHCKEKFPTLWEACKEEKERLKRPKITLKENKYTFTINEEEEIKKEYALEKSKEAPRTVQMKMIRVKALGNRKQVEEEAESVTEEELPDEESPEEVEDDDANEELLDALEKALDTEDVEGKSETPVELKKVMIFTVPLMTKQSNVVELAIKELILYIERKLKYKVERLHSDPGTEINTKKLRDRKKIEVQS